MMMNTYSASYVDVKMGSAIEQASLTNLIEYWQGIILSSISLDPSLISWKISVILTLFEIDSLISRFQKTNLFCSSRQGRVIPPDLGKRLRLPHRENAKRATV